MGHCSRNMEDSGVEGDLKCGDLVQEISEKTIYMGPRDCSCDSLVKNVTGFYPCPKILPEAKLMSFGLAE